mmetsp:Transcript_8243/g.12421  ORF Transcript_8243/g.12421 Transcript_8243/m.12421 type:complete len:559 (-) Transcript_8243:88-1764(-)
MNVINFSNSALVISHGVKRNIQSSSIAVQQWQYHPTHRRHPQQESSSQAPQNNSNNGRNSRSMNSLSRNKMQCRPSIIPSFSTLNGLSRNHYFFSTSTNSDGASNGNSNNTGDDDRNGMKLKQFIRPFLLTYHPDRLQNTTKVSREANLKAIQTLNGMVDTIDAIYNRAAEGGRTGNSNKTTSRIELQSTYSIEFLVPSNEDSVENSAGVKSKNKKYEPISTRRCVDLNFTKKECEMVQSIEGKTGRYSLTAAKIVKFKAMKEITKLLRVAGIQVSSSIEQSLKESEAEVKDDMVHRDKLGLHEQLILEEFDFLNDDVGGGGGRRSARNFDYSSYNNSQEEESTKHKSEYERSRDRFMKSVDWKEHRRLYNEAVEDMKRDIATQGLLKMSLERKQRLIAEIISRVRVHDVVAVHSGDVDSNVDADLASVDPLQQLIAIRRMSLIFTDNFEELEMEEMGKMWENVFIVLTPERPKGSGKVGAPFSRRKRLREGRESGFKFSYHDEGRLTIHIPIDFLDDELINELKRHLRDFYELCIGDVFEQFFPAHYKEFAGNPRIE